MYDKREMNYEQNIKDNFNFVFLCKKEDTSHFQEMENNFFPELFKTASNTFCCHEI